jgi:hypothetical protein
MPKQVSTTLSTPSAILTFPNLEKAAQIDGKGEPLFSANLLFDVPNFSPADEKLWRQLREAGLKDFIAKFGDGEDVIEDKAKFKLAEGYIWPIRSALTKKKYAGFTKGRQFISVKSQNRPSLGRLEMVDGKVKVVKTDDLSLFYPGAHVRAKVSTWAFDNVSKGLRFNLEALVFLTHGERLAGGGVDVQSAFEDEDFSAYNTVLNSEVEDDEDEMV